MNSNETIIPTNWITGQSSCTIIIPKFVLDELGLTDKNFVLMKSKNTLVIKSKELVSNERSEKCQV